MEGVGLRGGGREDGEEGREWRRREEGEEKMAMYITELSGEGGSKFTTRTGVKKNWSGRVGGREGEREWRGRDGGS